jgi:hypothetical protein
MGTAAIRALAGLESIMLGILGWDTQPCIGEPKKMGEAQRSLFLNWPQTPLTAISIPRC